MHVQDEDHLINLQLTLHLCGVQCKPPFNLQMPISTVEGPQSHTTEACMP